MLLQLDNCDYRARSKDFLTLRSHISACLLLHYEGGNVESASKVKPKPLNAPLVVGGMIHTLKKQKKNKQTPPVDDFRQDGGHGKNCKHTSEEENPKDVVGHFCLESCTSQQVCSDFNSEISLIHLPQPPVQNFFFSQA